MEAPRPNGWALVREKFDLENRPNAHWNEIQRALDLPQVNDDDTPNEASTSNQADTSAAGRPLQGKSL